MQDPTNQAELLARILSAHARFDAALDAVPEDRMDDALAPGAWSPRDILAHIAADNRWFSAQLAAAARGEAPTALEAYGDDVSPAPEFDFSTNEGRNAWHYSRNKGMLLADARARELRYRSRVLELIAALPESELFAPHTIADLGHVGHVRRAREGEQGWPLMQWIRGSTWHHYEDHAVDLERSVSP